MEIALDQAKASLSEGEFPVGCAIEYEGKILASSSRKHTTGKTINEVDHAEIVALKKFSEFNKHFDNEKIKKLIFPMFKKYFTQNELNEMAKKSENERKLFSIFTKFQKRIDLLENKVEA